jgi:hypothetical protein
MMQVGQLASFEEDRAHFGAWVVVSAPLTLGHDLTDDNITQRIWPIISNKLAIAINRAWAGSPGRLVSEIPSPHVNATFSGRRCGAGPYAQACCVHYDGPPHSPPHYDGTGKPPLCGTQVWAKPLSATNGSVAVLLLNNQDTDVANVSLKVKFATILPPGYNRTTSVTLQDVWQGTAVHLKATDNFETDAFGGHDSRFYVVTPLQPPLPSASVPSAWLDDDAATFTERGRSSHRMAAAETTTCEERCAGAGPAGGGAGADQPRFHHCCVGLNSTGQTPSCVRHGQASV